MISTWGVNKNIKYPKNSYIYILSLFLSSSQETNKLSINVTLWKFSSLLEIRHELNVDRSQSQLIHKLAL